MSKRMVVRCDGCGEQADMVAPGAAMTSSPAFGGGYFSPKPQPPDGWSERYAGMRGILDFCSSRCAAEWDVRHEGVRFG